MNRLLTALLLLALPIGSGGQELSSHRGAVAEITVSRSGYVYRKSPLRFIFDKDGRVVIRIVTDRLDTCSITSYSYDPSGRMSEKRHAVFNPASERSTRFYYDADGGMVAENEDYSISTAVAGRDAAGRDTAIIRSTTISRSGRTDSDTVVSSYDGVGRVVLRHTSKPGYDMRERFAYNDGGDITEYVRMDSRDTTARPVDSIVIRYEYEYDTLGNWIKRRDIYNDAVRIRYTRSIVYRAE